MTTDLGFQGVRAGAAAGATHESARRRPATRAATASAMLGGHG
ncbi:MAG TPA: hypothetical protein VFF24_15940 [Acidimicrobiia bacterium]|nr:hypothetical protein [Acidimicrobiia bacterium]